MVANDPVVTVVINTFNQEEFIIQCIQSVARQNFSERFEIVVIDDASSDLTHEILRKNLINFPGNIKLIRLEENEYSKGLWPGLNYIKEANGQFLAFCDGDDFWIDENKLTKQVCKIRSSSDIGIVHTDYFLLEQNGSKWVQNERSKLGVSQAALTTSSLDLIEGNNIKTSTALVKKNAIDFAFFENATHIPSKDWLLFLTVGVKHRISFMNEKTAVHRISSKGIWNGLPRDKQNQIGNSVAWYCAAHFPNNEIQNLFKRKVSREWYQEQLLKSKSGKYIKFLLGLKLVLSALLRRR